MLKGTERKHGSVTVDKKLNQRICEFVEVQPMERYVTTDEVLTFLLLKYPEYTRRKRKALSAAIQRKLQDILVERHSSSGPRHKRSKNSEEVLVSSSDSEMDAESTPLMGSGTVNSLNDTMRDIYQSQSQPCSPNSERKELIPSTTASVPNSPKQTQGEYFLDRQGARLQHPANRYAEEAVGGSSSRNTPEEFTGQRRERGGEGVVHHDIAEEEEVVTTRATEVFEVIRENLGKKVTGKSIAAADNLVEEVKNSMKSKLQKKTVISVEDLGVKSSNSSKSGKRRESAPHYSRRYDNESKKRGEERKAGEEKASSLFKHKMRPNVDGVSNEDENGLDSRATSSVRRRSSRMTDIRSTADREYRNLVQTSTTFLDMAGVDDIIEEVSRLLVHLLHPEIFTTLGVVPTQGILLYGPPGCGKTLLANAIAGELKLPFFSVTGTELISGFSGESEHNIRSLFRQARSLAPSILFIDEIDSICGKREEAQKDMERRVVTQLLGCIDDLQCRSDANVLVLAATNKPDAIDGSMRRAGRLDKEISLGIPNERQRIAILTKLCSPLKLDENFDFHRVAHNTPGYVAADLVSLVREASMTAVSRVLPDLFLERGGGPVEETQPQGSASSSDSECVVGGSKHSFRNLLSQRSGVPIPEQSLATIRVAMEDFLSAIRSIVPSAKREGFATVPDVTWADVGALSDFREELTMSILAPVKYPEKFEALGLSRSQGILIAGPPGCGKTLLAKAVANESGVNFISVKGPELLNMYVGESERAVRTVFQRARASAPCVIFFDEIDSLVPKRSTSEGNSSARVVNQLLTEMDGVDARKNVFIIGATNRIDIIDPAIMRPGRLDKTLFVTLPTAEDRLSILRTMTRSGKPKLSANVALSEIADATQGYTGADLSAVLREASILCLKEDMLAGRSGDDCTVSREHFTRALHNVQPSVSAADRLAYEQMSRSRTGQPI